MNCSRSVEGLTLAAGLCLAMMAVKASAQDLLISSRFTNQILRYDAASGAPKGVFASGGGMANPNGIAYGPDGNFYAGNGDDGAVLRYNGQTGAFMDVFVTAGAGGNQGCRQIAFGPNGDLYIDNGAGNNVLRFNGQTGAFVGIAASGNGMNGPVGLAFGPTGDLFVGAALSNRVYRFKPNGQIVRSYSVSGVSNATGVAFDSAGKLYVAFSVTNRVYRFDPDTGANLGVFASGGGLNTATYLTFQSDGNLLVGSFGNDSALLFSGANGSFIKTLVQSGSGGLDGTHCFAFMPSVPAPGFPALALAWPLAARRRRALPTRDWLALRV